MEHEYECGHMYHTYCTYTMYHADEGRREEEIEGSRRDCEGGRRARAG